MTKRIAAGLLALTMIFGGAVVSAEETYSEENAPAETETFEVSEEESLDTFGATTYTYGDYKYQILDSGTIGITEYNGNDSAISIPSQISGRKVTQINKKAFGNCKNLTSVTIPNSITTICSGAFNRCTNLKSITIPSSVTEIGDGDHGNYGCYGVFEGCTSLASITIPSSVKKIGSCAFEDCTSLTSITVPNSVTEIGRNAFDGCTSLNKVTIPSSVMKINRDTFYDCANLTNITIPRSVTEINGGAFYGCSSLKSITIPNSVTKIGGGYTNTGAFEKCTGLTSVTIPNSVKELRTRTFMDCTSLKSVTISNGITKIDEETFSGCTSLTSATIPSGVTEIGEGAFYGCTSLKSITIPISVTKIGGGTYSFDPGAFEECTNLTDVYYTGSKNQWTAISIGSRNGWLTGANIHYNYVAPHTHTYKITVVPPTYSSQGYTEHKCTICGDSYKDNYKAQKTVPTASTASFTSETNSVKIIWNRIPEASGYRIYRYDTSSKKWKSLKTVSNGYTVTYKDQNLKAGTNYKYKVKAYVKENGKTYWGNSSATLTTATKPSTMKITKAGKSSTAVRIYWNKVACSGYQIQKYDPSTKKWTTVKTLDSTPTNYRISGLRRNTSYKFRIRAYKTAGSQKVYGAWSAAKKVTTKK